MALLEAKTVLLQLLPNFSFQLAENHSADPLLSATMSMKHGLPMTVSPM
jgi:hypothetical protein